MQHGKKGERHQRHQREKIVDLLLDRGDLAHRDRIGHIPQRRRLVQHKGGDHQPEQGRGDFEEKGGERWHPDLGQH